MDNPKKNDRSILQQNHIPAQELPTRLQAMQGKHSPLAGSSFDFTPLPVRGFLPSAICHAKTPLFPFSGKQRRLAEAEKKNS